MKIHHLSCGTMCPVGGAFFDGFSKGLKAELVCHTLLVETSEGLVLVDTGFGMEDVKNHKRLSSFFRKFNNIQFREEHTALYQIQKLGFKREEVKHIVLTHLDFDHAGGIFDFPQARVHVMETELRAAMKSQTWLDRNRYSKPQWAHEKNWVSYSSQGEKWYGFDSVTDLQGLPPEILMIPLVGHTKGHAGIALQTPNGWLLHAGDAYFFRGEMNVNHHHCTPGLSFYQKMMEVDREKRLYNQDRLRTLIRENHEVQVFSAHDAVEFKAYQRLQANPDYQANATAGMHPVWWKPGADVDTGIQEI